MKTFEQSLNYCKNLSITLQVGFLRWAVWTGCCN